MCPSFSWQKSFGQAIAHPHLHTNDSDDDDDSEDDVWIHVSASQLCVTENGKNGLRYTRGPPIRMGSFGCILSTNTPVRLSVRRYKFVSVCFCVLLCMCIRTYVKYVEGID